MIKKHIEWCLGVFSGDDTSSGLPSGRKAFSFPRTPIAMYNDASRSLARLPTFAVFFFFSRSLLGLRAPISSTTSVELVAIFIADLTTRFAAPVYLRFNFKNNCDKRGAEAAGNLPVLATFLKPGVKICANDTLVQFRPANVLQAV